MIRRPPSSPLFPSPPLSRSPLATAAPEPFGTPVKAVPRGSTSTSSRTTSLGFGSVTVPLNTAERLRPLPPDRKSTRLNSSHSQISYAVFCLKKKKENTKDAYYYFIGHIIVAQQLTDSQITNLALQILLI